MRTLLPLDASRAHIRAKPDQSVSRKSDEIQL